MGREVTIPRGLTEEEPHESEEWVMRQWTYVDSARNPCDIKLCRKAPKSKPYVTISSNVEDDVILTPQILRWLLTIAEVTK